MPVKQRTVTWVQVEPVSPQALNKKTQNQYKNQVVQTEKVDKSTVAAKNAFLGEQTQTVDRQSVSSSHTTVMGRTKNLARNESESERKASSRRQAKRKSVAAKPLPTLGNLGVPMIAKVRPETDEQVAHDENWAAQGGNSPQDYVKGIRDSDRTLLNTKEFVFYGYYQRIRERLDREWVPVLREKLIKYYNTGRHLASDMDHTTQVLVILNQKGEITAVKIVSESGTQDLDDAAVEAFNQAGPFPNPPQGIIGADGTIQIPWEFILRT